MLVIDALLKTRYSQKIGDDLSVSVWLSNGVSTPFPSLWGPGWQGPRGPSSCCPCGQAVAGCRVAAVFMQYGVVANYCWLLVEGVYLHSLLGRATFPERSFFPLYLAVGWGEWAAEGRGRGGGGHGEAGTTAAPSPQAPPCSLSSPGPWSSVCLRTSSEYELSRGGPGAPKGSPLLAAGSGGCWRGALGRSRAPGDGGPPARGRTGWGSDAAPGRGWFLSASPRFPRP